MKKIIQLLLLFILPLSGFAQIQINEGFENGIPSDWTVFDNGISIDEDWGITTDASRVNSGTKAAQILRENIGVGVLTEEWLVMPLQTIQANSQLRFFSRSLLNGDQKTVYQIRISKENPTDPKDVSSYSVYKTYTEFELSSSYNVYQEHKESLFVTPGASVYIAFVKVFKQVDSNYGDSWLLDDVSISPQCFDPTSQGVAANPAVTGITARLTWALPSNGTPSGYEVFYGASPLPNPNQNPPAPSAIKTSTNLYYDAPDLTPASVNEFYVRSVCSDVSKSDWIGPYLFITKPLGTICSEPIAVNALPYQITGQNTSMYGDEVDVMPGTGCGTVPSTTNYLAGDEVFYSFKATKTGAISVTMTPAIGSTSSSIFVYKSCGDLGLICYGGVANASTAPRVVNLNVEKDSTYIIVVSSSAFPQSVIFDLTIQEEECIPKPTALIAANEQIDAVDLSWTDTTHTSWQVEVQDLGSSIPSGAGTYYVTDNPNTTISGLIAGHQYQYWVRAECAPGSNTWTGWEGPKAFNTKICLNTDTCNHIFRLTDTANNGWNGAVMQVRQNGIVVGTLGPTYTSGAGPVDITVTLCKDQPFDVYWLTPGSAPQQCVLSVINSFGQTIFNQTGGYSPEARIMYSGVVNCNAPVCNLSPTNLTSVPSSKTALLDWSAPATTDWEIYLVPKGSGQPIPTTPGNMPNVVKPYTATGLLADTCYDFYVRVKCSPEPSPWSQVATFCTLPTCPKPTGLAVTPLTPIAPNATLYWTPAVSTDTNWDVLLIPSTSTTPPPFPSANPSYPGQLTYTADLSNTTLSGTSRAFNVSNLDPATIYFYYVRTVCFDGTNTDNGVWQGPIMFNTQTCDATTKCAYKFILTDSGKNGWDNGRMQVRQNGIVVQTLGGTITGEGPTVVNVGICPGIPFDLYWSVAGNKPEEIGVQVQNPFTDIIYNKVPGGTESPLTVLYASTGNCTPPTCPKPTTLLVANVTQTTADLNWTENAGATKWEVYVAPTGSTPPVNGAPVSGVSPYYIVTSKPFTVTDLQPATSYTYYVRALCSDTDYSTWTILAPKTFITKPVNDECIGALPVQVSPARTPVYSVSGNSLGATQSNPATSPVCAGTIDDDVWFSFVATSPTHIITLSNIVGTLNLNHAVYSAGVSGDCAAMTQLYCSNQMSNGNGVSVATGLTSGVTYMIRVFTAATAQTASFTVSITTPETITNDECSTATTAIVVPGLECDVTTPGSLTGATKSSDASTCIGNRDDDVWYSFVATNSTHYFSLLDVTGTTVDLNFSVYSGNCGALVQKYCSASNTLSGSLSGLSVGQMYYVRVWSNSSVLQDVTFGLCIGTVLPPITTSTTAYTPPQLVEDVLLGTKCASVENVKWSTGTNFGSVNGIGYFDKSLSAFPFMDGVILSSGDALRAPGPNSTVQLNGSSSWPGDQDLMQIMSDAGVPMNSSWNASVLEFDFVPLANKISFNFLFASEEYGVYQCSYSDAFAFILTDSVTGEDSNLAIVPGTANTPVSVVTIRDKAFNGACDSQNPEYFAHYYNPPIPPGIPAIGGPTNFNGMTVPLIAQSEVIKNRKYHIKLVVADRGDTAYDSAVFLEGGSFDIGSVDLGSDVTGTSAVCLGETYTINSELNPNDYTINWTKDGQPIAGEHNPTLVVTSPGNYCVNAQFGVSSCFATDCIQIDYYQEPTAGTPVDMVICDASGVGVFDLTQNTPKLLAPYEGSTVNHTVAYYTSQEDADNNTNVIPNPTNYTNVTPTQTIYARVNNDYVSCYQVKTFQLIVGDLTPKFTLGGAMSYCPEGSTTITVVPTDNNFDPNTATYSWIFNGNEVGTSKSLFISTVAGYGTYSVTVNNGGCTATQTFEITNSNTVWEVVITAPATLCAKESDTLSVTVSNNTAGSPAIYTYTLADTTLVGPTSNNSITITGPGTYQVEVDILGCKTTQTATVGVSAATVPLEVVPGCDGKDFKLKAITPDPANDEYVWTGPNFSVVENEPYTIVVNEAGTYTVLVTNADGCTSEEVVDVLAYQLDCTIQKGISPNGDGKNDNFKVTDAKKLEIYNRYGVKVYGQSPYSYSNQDSKSGWYGQTDAGDELPDGTYYYIITRNNGAVLTGWIYILR